MGDNLVWQNMLVSKNQHKKNKNQKPCIIWFTGLSGSGKSTLANALENELFKLRKHTYLLDGDNLRLGLNSDLGFSERDRIENIRRIGEVARLFVDAGIIVIAAFISPYKKGRNEVRRLVDESEFIEVYVSTPLGVCEKREQKGLYKKARAGEIANFTGISSPFEAPENPEINIHNDQTSVEEGVQIILNYLKNNNYLHSGISLNYEMS